MKERLSNKTELWIALLLACFYLGMAMWLQSGGWHSAQSLFFAEKAQLLVAGEHSGIKINLFTYPLIGFILSLPYGLINTVAAPVIASSLGMSCLAYCLLVFLRKENAGLLVRIATLALFIIHPTSLFIAVSGSTAYLTLLVALLYYIGMFRYLTNHTTFYLAISSMLLSVMVLVDYKMIWMGLFALPVFLIVCAQHLPSLDGAAPQPRFKNIFSDHLIRQEYILSLFSRLFLFYLLPVVVFISYVLLNDLYTNNPLYFIDSLYANPLAAEGLKGSNTLFASPDIIDESLWVVMGRVALGCMPLIVVALYAMGKDISRVILLCSTFLLVALQLMIYPYIPQRELFLLVVLVAILAIQSAKARMDGSWYMWPACAFALMFLFAGSWYNLYNSPLLAERTLITTMLGTEKPTAFEAEKQVAAFITTQVAAGEKVLTDDAVSYPIVALTQNTSKFILPYHTFYSKAIQSPADQADYVLVFKHENILNLTDKLSLQFGLLLQTEGANYLPVFKAGNWVVYKTRQHS